MKAVILAAGVGSRLLPETEMMPKCLLTVEGKSILEHQLDALNECGVNDIIIVIGYKGDMIKQLIGDRAKYIESKEYESTNSSYSLWLAREELKDGFIYLNADLVFHPALLKKLLDAKESDAIIFSNKIRKDSDMFKLSMNGNKIHHMDKNLDIEEAKGEAIGPVKISEKGASIVFNKLDNLIKSGDKNNWVYPIFSQMSKEHDFFGIECGDLPWQEIDTPEDLKSARAKI